MNTLRLSISLRGSVARIPRRQWLLGGCTALAIGAGLLALTGCGTTGATTATATAPTTTSAAPPDKNEGAKGKPLRVGVNAVVPPVVFKQDGQYVGFEADFARGLGQQLGRRVEFVEMNWVDLLPAVQQGRVDIAMSGVTLTPERKMLVDFTTPYLRSGVAAVVRQDQEDRLTVFFGGKTKLGVKPGTTSQALIQQRFPRNPLTFYRNPDDAVQALVKGKLEMFFIDAPIAWWLAVRNPKAGLTVGGSLLNTEYLAWAVRKGDTATLDAANQYTRTIQKNGDLEKTMHRWLNGFYKP